MRSVHFYKIIFKIVQKLQFSIFWLTWSRCIELQSTCVDKIFISIFTFQLFALLNHWLKTECNVVKNAVRKSKKLDYTGSKQKLVWRDSIWYCVQAGVHVVGVLERFQSEVYRKGVLQEKEVKISQKQQNTLLIVFIFLRGEKVKTFQNRKSANINVFCGCLHLMYTCTVYKNHAVMQN